MLLPSVWTLVSAALVGATVDLTRESRDCEIVRLPQQRSLKSFEDTLQVAVFPLDASWRAVSTLSDDLDNKCFLDITVNAENASVAFVNVTCSNNVTASSNITDAFLPEEWTQLFLSAETSGVVVKEEEGKEEKKEGGKEDEEDPDAPQKSFDVLAMVRNKKGRDNFLKIMPTDLRPPLKMRWYTSNNVSVVFNCGKGTGCQLHKDALHHGRGRDSFYFHRGVFPAGVDVQVSVTKYRFVNISLDEELGDRAGWRGIQIKQERNALSVWVDDKRVKKIKTRQTFPDNDILNVKLRGDGQLTWCDPRPTAEVTEAPVAGFTFASVAERPDFLPWILVATFLLTSIIVTACLIRSRRKLARTKRSLRFLESRSPPSDSSLFPTIVPPQDLQLIPTATPTVTPTNTPSTSFAPSLASRNSNRASQLSFDNPWPHLIHEDDRD